MSAKEETTNESPALFAMGVAIAEMFESIRVALSQFGEGLEWGAKVTQSRRTGILADGVTERDVLDSIEYEWAHDPAGWSARVGEWFERRTHAELDACAVQEQPRGVMKVWTDSYDQLVSL